ncbi:MULTISPECIES: DUF3854 domain-containing protein [Nostoc]|uniref:DUF3854 domain-containing protein n=1 Tax=Nostoc TaxID=1177 RepID=UPI002412C734|nr:MULTISPECIES: DUF3854 domain-containing protein [Nostoc]
MAQHNVPVTIVEGVKKAGALLTAGYAAIAIPGVNAGYRTPRKRTRGRVRGGRGENLSPMLPAPLLIQSVNHL